MSLEDELFEQRAARVHEIEALGFRPFGKRFDFTCTVPDILAEHTDKTADQLVPEIRVKLAGRIQTIRRMGKAGFMHIQQNGARLQCYVRKDAVSRSVVTTSCSPFSTSVTSSAPRATFFAPAPRELSLRVESLEFLFQNPSRHARRSSTALEDARDLVGHTSATSI